MLNSRISRTYISPNYNYSSPLYRSNSISLKLLGQWAWGLGYGFMPLEDDLFTYYRKNYIKT